MKEKDKDHIVSSQTFREDITRFMLKRSTSHLDPPYVFFSNGIGTLNFLVILLDSKPYVNFFIFLIKVFREIS